MKSTKYQLLEADFQVLQKDLKLYRGIIEQLRGENENFKKNNEALVKTNEAASHQNIKYEDALREIDKHIKATDSPTIYIKKILKKTLPEYSRFS